MFRILLGRFPGAEAPALEGTQGEAAARIVRALEAEGAAAISEDMATALRIEAGRGAWGHDLAEDVIPLEAGLLDRAISTTKGCYVGQEIVIRILHRGGGRVAKKLVTLLFDPATSDLPAVKSPIEVDGKPIGHLTSVAYSPAHERLVALGYVHRDVAEAGRRVDVSGSTLSGVITGLAQ
jgi:folate-binding protein YgfZ